MKRLLGLLLAAVVACGPSPEARDARPSGELVVVIRQGPERVPFRPDVARIKAANEQLAGILGHSIAIEIDGSILPQTHEGAQQVIADLVEVVTRDIAALEEPTTPGLPRELTYARRHFRRLVVRYDPAESARRTHIGDRHPSAQLDIPSGTIDVVLGQAALDAIVPGSIRKQLVIAARSELAARYADVMPEQLPASERGAWLVFQEGHRAPSTPRVNVVGMRGALWLVQKGDPVLAKQARAWLFGKALDDLGTAYMHEMSVIRTLRPGAPFLVMEAELIRWFDAEQAAFTLEERGQLAHRMWQGTFREDRSFVPRSFPGFDRMSFAFTTIDLWIAAGHPRTSDALLGFVEPVAPVWKAGHLQYERVESEHDTTRTGEAFYAWVFEDPQRTDVLERAVQQRDDEHFAATAFAEAKKHLSQAQFMRFLRGFEGKPSQWKLGASILQDDAAGMDGALLEEARRLWREVPGARGHALLWFGITRRTPDDPMWQDIVRDHVASEADIASFLELDAPAISCVPVVWPALPRQGRVRPLVRRIDHVLDRDASLAPTMVHAATSVAQQLCKERSPEAAELRAWADATRAKRPGAGFATIVDQATCSAASSGARPQPPQRPQKKQK